MRGADVEAYAVKRCGGGSSADLECSSKYSDASSEGRSGAGFQEKRIAS